MRHIFGHTPPSPPNGYVQFMNLSQREDGTYVLTVRPPHTKLGAAVQIELGVDVLVGLELALRRELSGE